MTLEETIAKCEAQVEILIKSMNACDLDDPVEKLLARNDAKGADGQRQLAEWLKELDERRKQPDIIRCKDCKHYHTDVCGSELGIDGMYGNIIVAHDACDRWTKGMNCVEPEGFCFLAERNE